MEKVAAALFILIGCYVSSGALLLLTWCSSQVASVRPLAQARLEEWLGSWCLWCAGLARWLGGWECCGGEVGGLGWDWG